jgi:hypothetical protein
MKHPPFKYVEWDSVPKPHITFYNDGEKMWSFSPDLDDPKIWKVWESLDAKINWTHPSKKKKLTTEQMHNLILFIFQKGRNGFMAIWTSVARKNGFSI